MKPHVLFIFMDAVRPDHLSCYGYHRNTSPIIDSLANKGTIFKNAFSTHNATDKSLLTILSGRHTLLSETPDPLIPPKELTAFYTAGGTLISEILQEKGYKTYWLHQLYGWQKKGFDFFFEEDIENKEGGIIANLKRNSSIRKTLRTITHYLPKNLGDAIKNKGGRTTAEHVTKKAISIIEDSKKDTPFFMIVHYDDSHIPYNPKEFTGTFEVKKEGKPFFETIYKKKINQEYTDFLKGAFSKNTTFEEIIARYDETILRQDHFIGTIIDALKKKGLFENTIIVLFSDHGESFDTHGIFFDHHGLYDPSTRVPLLLHGPGIPKGAINEKLVTHEDILPTLLPLLHEDYSKDTETFDGQEVLKSPQARDYIYLEECLKMKKQAIRTATWKYIQPSQPGGEMCTTCNEVHGGKIELYNLQKDPQETNNIAKNNPKKVAEMKNILSTHVTHMKLLQEKRRIKHALSNRVLVPPKK